MLESLIVLLTPMVNAITGYYSKITTTVSKVEKTASIAMEIAIEEMAEETSFMSDDLENKIQDLRDEWAPLVDRKDELITAEMLISKFKKVRQLKGSMGILDKSSSESKELKQLQKELKGLDDPSEDFDIMDDIKSLHSIPGKIDELQKKLDKSREKDAEKNKRNILRIETMRKIIETLS